MISRVKGQIVAAETNYVVIDVNGIGYEVLVSQPLRESLHLDDQVEFLTYHHVRENTQELYGFDSSEAKILFEQLLGVSGVGPKSALAIMSLGDQQKVRQAIASEDAAFIAVAAGVGKRSAERVIVELKDKVNMPGQPMVAGDDAAAALVALGYNPVQATQALSGIPVELDTETRVKQALRKLS